MKMTVGPLPPGVYWRRRAAVGAVLLAVLLGFATCTGNSDAAQPTASTLPASPSASPPSVTPSPVASVSPSSPAVQPPVASAAAAPAAASGPAPMCTNDQLELTASLTPRAVPSGTMPKLHLSVRNTSASACRRDLGANQQELRVMDGTRRLWSSDDCYPLRGSAVWTLAPGANRTYTLTWAAKDSVPGCAQVRKRLEPGQYDLVARLGTLTGERTAFSIV